jgi:biotin carboxyl carrier protein
MTAAEPRIPHGGGLEIRAEIVGTVIGVDAAAGDTVVVGDPIAMLESMKMEIPVLAERSGRIADLAVSVGDVVKAGDLIAIVE